MSPTICIAYTVEEVLYITTHNVQMTYCRFIVEYFVPTVHL